MNEAVAAAWDKVVEDWQNQARHDALMSLVVNAKEFKWAATKYREKKGDPIADAQLAKLTSAAMATMLVSTRTKDDKDPAAVYKRALIWLLVLVVMLLCGMIAVKLMAQSHPQGHP